MRDQRLCEQLPIAVANDPRLSRERAVVLEQYAVYSPTWDDWPPPSTFIRVRKGPAGRRWGFGWLDPGRRRNRAPRFAFDSQRASSFQCDAPAMPNSSCEKLSIWPGDHARPFRTTRRIRIWKYRLSSTSRQSFISILDSGPHAGIAGAGYRDPRNHGYKVAVKPRYTVQDCDDHGPFGPRVPRAEKRRRR